MNAPLTLKQMKTIIENPVELDPRLMPFVEHFDEDHTAIKHPLIIEPQRFPALNKIYNLRFEAALKARDEAFKQQDWEAYIYAYERAYWLDQFDSVKDKLPNCEFWRILGEIITDCENLWQYKTLLHRLLSSRRSNQNPMLATGRVNKRDVIACFITNGGNDVLVRASNVKSKRASAIDPVAA